MLTIVFVTLLLTIVFFISLWHLDINHNLDRLGKKQTRGVLKISPEKGYRISQYSLIVIVLLLDLLILYLLFR